MHSCGHHAQCESLLGIAVALKEENALKGLCGKIKLCFVPAEELLEIDYRNDLMNKGIIKFCGGKPEFLYRGYFDTTDIAFMVHTSCDDNYFTREGAVGTGHGDDYYLVDPERACVNSAKWQLAMLYLLLKDNGAKALQIKKDFKPLFSTKEEYFKYLEKIESSGDRITYLENGTAKVKL